MGHYGVGLELIQLQRWAEAVEAFGQAISADSNYSAAYYHQARAQIANSDPDGARATLTTGIEVAKNVGDMKTVNEMMELQETI